MHPAAPSEAPQEEQKRPLARAPQLPQTEGVGEGDVMAGNVAAEFTAVQT